MTTITTANLASFLELFPEFGAASGVQVGIDLLVTGDDDVTISRDATVSTIIEDVTYTFRNTATTDTTISPETTQYWGIGDDNLVPSSVHLLFRHDGFVAVPRDARWIDLPSGVTGATNANAGRTIYTTGDIGGEIQRWIDIAESIHQHNLRPLAQLYLAAHFHVLYSANDNANADARATLQSETIGPYEIEFQRLSDATKTIRSAFLQRTKYGRIYIQLEPRYPTGRAAKLKHV